MEEEPMSSFLMMNLENSRSLRQNIIAILEPRFVHSNAEFFIKK